MTAVRNFFLAIRQDFELLSQEDQAKQCDRVHSVSFKIVGVALATFTLALFVTALCVVASTPFTSLGLLIATGACIPLAHDFIVLGNNFHDTANLNLQIAADAVRESWNMLRNGRQISKTEFHLRATWIFKPVYIACTGCC